MQGVGSIPGWGAKIPHVSAPKNQSIKQNQYCNKFNRDFKNDPCQKILKKIKRHVILICAIIGDGSFDYDITCHVSPQYYYFSFYL